MPPNPSLAAELVRNPKKVAKAVVIAFVVEPLERLAKWKSDVQR